MSLEVILSSATKKLEDKKTAAARAEFYDKIRKSRPSGEIPSMMAAYLVTLNTKYRLCELYRMLLSDNLIPVAYYAHFHPDSKLGCARIRSLTRDNLSEFHNLSDNIWRTIHLIKRSQCIEVSVLPKRRVAEYLSGKEMEIIASLSPIVNSLKTVIKQFMNIYQIFKITLPSVNYKISGMQIITVNEGMLDVLKEEIFGLKNRLYVAFSKLLFYESRLGIRPRLDTRGKLSLVTEDPESVIFNLPVADSERESILDLKRVKFIHKPNRKFTKLIEHQENMEWSNRIMHPFPRRKTQ